MGDDLARAVLTVSGRSGGLNGERMLDAYIQSFSHELRNHLQTAKTELQGIQDDEESFDRVRAVFDRIERLDREVLLLTRQSIADDRLSTHSLSEIIDDVRVRMPLIGNSLLVLDSKPIVSHRPLVELLLENLFRNALDHAGPAAQIRVGMIDDGFFVEDTGDGLPEVPPQSLFGWGASVNGNSGTGLAIVKRITDLHGWEISATEPAEGGARFEITGVTIAQHPGASAPYSDRKMTDE